MTGKCAKTAQCAAKLAIDGENPVQAWRIAAAENFPGKPAAEIKSCPKSAFLALAEAGLLPNVSAGSYTKSIDNRRYALTAFELLQRDESWLLRPKELWTEVAETTGKKTHNQQMHVVIAVWLMLHGRADPDECSYPKPNATG